MIAPVAKRVIINHLAAGGSHGHGRVRHRERIANVNVRPQRLFDVKSDGVKVVFGRLN